MVLVDTSVLIDYLRGKENEATGKFQHILDASIPFGINSFIYQELLQGSERKRNLTSSNSTWTPRGSIDFGMNGNPLLRQHEYILNAEKEAS